MTTGAWIYAAVSICEENNNQIEIDGGIGVGRVTRPGLDQPVGNAAINTVPRQMIAKEVSEVCHLFDFQGGIKVVISVPEGENLAAQTFNPRLGIKGGISILGTSGNCGAYELIRHCWIPIAVELKQKRAEGHSIVAISPGNYGLEFMKRTYGYDLQRSVKCSNFIGQTIDMVKELGFSKMLLTGHIGKLIKVSGGIMNTHSKEADCRMELLAAAAIRAGAEVTLLREILDCIGTEDAVDRIKKAGFLEPAMEYVMEKMEDHLKHRAGGGLEIECMVYSNDIGLLGVTPGAVALLKELLEEKE